MAAKINLTPNAIVETEFDIDWKGYNPDQVDHMLDQVIEDYQAYEANIRELQEKLSDQERINASLKAKIIELEGKAKASEGNDPISASASNVDILKRLSRLEKQVTSIEESLKKKA